MHKDIEKLTTKYIEIEPIFTDEEWEEPHFECTTCKRTSLSKDDLEFILDRCGKFYSDTAPLLDIKNKPSVELSLHIMEKVSVKLSELETLEKEALKDKEFRTAMKKFQDDPDFDPFS